MIETRPARKGQDPSTWSRLLANLDCSVVQSGDCEICPREPQNVAAHRWRSAVGLRVAGIWNGLGRLELRGSISNPPKTFMFALDSAVSPCATWSDCCGRVSPWYPEYCGEETRSRLKKNYHGRSIQLGRRFRPLKGVGIWRAFGREGMVRVHARTVGAGLLCRPGSRSTIALSWPTRWCCRLLVPLCQRDKNKSDISNREIVESDQRERPRRSTQTKICAAKRHARSALGHVLTTGSICVIFGN